MSKIVTTRYEYVTYDDADPSSCLTAVPPSYPPTLDQYCTTSVATSGAGYGVQNFAVAAASPTSVLIPAGAGAIVVGDPGNAGAFAIVLTGPPIPGATPVSITFLVGPGQTVSLPGSLNATGQVSVYPTSNNGAGGAAIFPVAGQILWSW